MYGRETNIINDQLKSWKEYAESFSIQEYLIQTLVYSLIGGVSAYVLLGIITFITRGSRKALFSISAITAFTILGAQAWIRFSPQTFDTPQINEQTAKLLMIALAEETRDKNAVPDLIKILENTQEDSDLRIKSADALGVIGDARAITSLQKLAMDDGESSRLKISIIWALGNITASEDNREKHFDYSVFLHNQIGVYNELLSIDNTFAKIR